MHARGYCRQGAWSRASGLQPRVLGCPSRPAFPVWHGLSSPGAGLRPVSRGLLGLQRRGLPAPRSWGTPCPVDCTLCAPLMPELCPRLWWGQDEGGREPGRALVTGACCMLCARVSLHGKPAGWALCPLPGHCWSGWSLCLGCSLRLHPGLTAEPRVSSPGLLSPVCCTLQRCASRVCLLLCDSVFSRRWARKGVRWGPFSAGTLTYPEKVRWLLGYEGGWVKENGSLWWEQFNSPFICCFHHKGRFPHQASHDSLVCVSSACGSEMRTSRGRCCHQSRHPSIPEHKPTCPLGFWETCLWFHVVYLINSSSVIAGGDDSTVPLSGVNVLSSRP